MAKIKNSSVLKFFIFLLNRNVLKAMRSDRQVLAADSIPLHSF